MSDVSGSKISHYRVLQAFNVNADILCTACPLCITHLEDAVRAQDLDGKILVRDLSELIIENIVTDHFVAVTDHRVPYLF